MSGRATTRSIAVNVREAVERRVGDECAQIVKSFERGREEVERLAAAGKWQDALRETNATVAQIVHETTGLATQIAELAEWSALVEAPDRVAEYEIRTREENS